MSEHEPISYFDDGNEAAVADDLPSVTATRETPGGEPERLASNPAAKPAGGMPKIVWVIGAVIFVAFAAWMFWPAGSPNQVRRYPPQAIATPTAPAAMSGPSENAVTPNQPESKAVAEAPAVAAPAVSASAPTPTGAPMFPVAATSPVQTPTPAASPAPSASVMSTAQGAALEDRLGSLEGKVDGLATKLDSLASVAKTPGASATSRSAKHAATTPKELASAKEKPAKAKASAQEGGVRALNGQFYTVNTIGRGIAWIQAGEHIDIVQAGDRVGQVRVLSIDPVQRRVVTSDGVIQ